MEKFRFTTHEPSGSIDPKALSEIRTAIATHLGMNERDVFGDGNPAGPFDRLRLQDNQLILLRDRSGEGSQVLDSIDTIEWRRLLARFRGRIDILLVTSGFGEPLEEGGARAEA